MTSATFVFEACSFGHTEHVPQYCAIKFDMALVVRIKELIELMQTNQLSEVRFEYQSIIWGNQEFTERAGCSISEIIVYTDGSFVLSALPSNSSSGLAFETEYLNLEFISNSLRQPSINENSLFFVDESDKEGYIDDFGHNDCFVA